MKIGSKEILFCEIHPVTYWISTEKEVIKRHLKDYKAKINFATKTSNSRLPNIVTKNDSALIKKGPGIDPALQYNKAHNIKISSQTMHGLIVEPGEIFSFWRLVGRISERKGYRDGRVIMDQKIDAGLGGGLCNLANSINLLLLHSPLNILEFHTHSDALAPDNGKRVPFATGTSVAYNSQDLRFVNNTNQKIQILVWIEDEILRAELRSENEFPDFYRLIEEDHHFKKIGEKYYRISTIYRETVNRETKKVKDRSLVLNNKSEVMFDHSLIPQDLIR